MIKLPYVNQLTPTRIWELEQNKPRLIARDLEYYSVPKSVTHTILLARGVYKWFSVRRDLIKLKNAWKSALSAAYKELESEKRGGDRDRVMYLRGYVEAMQLCRRQVRELCHSERWQAPDNDPESQMFLETMESELPPA